MELFEKIVNKTALITSYFAQFALAFAMLIIVANVISRIRWNPVPGTVELVEMSGAIILSMGVAYTAVKKGHIMVDVLVEKFPVRIRGIVEVITTSIALFFMFLLTRQAFVYAGRMMDRGLITGHLGIPIAPSIYIVGVGFAILSLVLVLDILKSFIAIIKGGEEKK